MCTLIWSSIVYLSRYTYLYIYIYLQIEYVHLDMVQHRIYLSIFIYILIYIYISTNRRCSPWSGPASARRWRRGQAAPRCAQLGRQAAAPSARPPWAWRSTGQRWRNTNTRESFAVTSDLRNFELYMYIYIYIHTYTYLYIYIYL